jgi:fructose-1,6-bisphosphatase
MQRPDSKGTIQDVLRPGSEMVAAGYTMSASLHNLYLCIHPYAFVQVWIICELGFVDRVRGEWIHP